MPDLHAPPTISARIDRLPPCGTLWSWVARISFGAFFEIYEIALTSLLAPALVFAGIFHKDQAGLFGLPDLAAFAFGNFAGLFAGALVFSTIADRFGRRPIFTYSLVWYAVATLVMSAQSTALSICLWRFVAPLGVGAESRGLDAHLAELMPQDIRGRRLSIRQNIQFNAFAISG